MNGAADGNIGSGASSDFAWTHPAFARAVNLPKVANFFFVLFLFGKEKGHRKTGIFRLSLYMPNKAKKLGKTEFFC